MIKCINCGSTDNIHWHHVVPLALGGNDIPSNIVPVCGRCHSIIHNNKALDGKYLHYRGVQRAKEEGKYRGRKPKQVDPELFREVYWQWKDKEIKTSQAAEILKITNNMFYRRVKEFEKYGSL